MNGEKLPPHDNEAEEAVLGSLLIDSDAIFSTATILESKDFHQEQNRWVYEACLELYKRGATIDQITVADELERQDKLEAVGRDYLSHLISSVPSSVYVEHYAEIVHRLSVMRSLITAAGQIAAIGYQSGMDAEESLSKAEGLLFGLRHGYVRGDFVHISKVLDQYFEETGEEEEEHAARKVNTGFNALDEKLGKLEPADMIILAARPSAGKTTLALNIALSASLEKKSRVAIFSLEMARLPLVGRLISCQANIDFRHIRLGQISGSEEKRLLDATGILSECPIYIDDTPQIRMMEIRGKSRRLYYEKGIDLIIIDYLQLIMGDGRSENRVQEVSHISRSIKALARELNVPVIAISQLSRAVEWRTSHRPQLSDLRESGSIEQDADIVMFISRDELYIKEEDWQKDHPEEPYPRGIADVIIAKHRNGPTGEVKLRFFPQYSRFENIEALDRSFQF